MSALFSGRVALKLQVVKHAREHLDDLAKDAPTHKKAVLVRALSEHVKQVELFLTEFLETCKEDEKAAYPITPGGTTP